MAKPKQTASERDRTLSGQLSKTEKRANIRGKDRLTLTFRPKR